MKKIFTKERLINIFLILFSLSTILDLHIFYNSISTLIRSLVIVFFFLTILIFYSKPQDKKKLFLYFFLCIIYITMHHLNALNFKSLVPGDFNYSLFSELLYFLKMLTNIMLFFVIYKLNIKYINIKNYLKAIVLFISLSIVITDIFKISYTAYTFNHTTIPFYKWFSLDKYDFINGSSKGWFHMTNQIVAVLLLYLPIISYESFKEKKLFNYILVILIILSQLVIGNRLAIYGSLIELILLTIIYFILNIKRKQNKLYLALNMIIIVLIGLLIPFTPLRMREYYYEAIYNNQELSFMDSNNISYKVIDDHVDALEEELKAKEIDSMFYKEAYPCKYDKEYWQDISKLDVTKTGNARYMEQSIVKRVKNINNNKLDNLFGLTYVRVMNIFNIEKDYIMQYYSIGIIGCLLFLSLYIVLYGYSLVKILFDLKHKFNEKNIALLLGIGIVLLSAYFSGNILNSISMIIPITILLSILFNEVRIIKTKQKEEKIMGFAVSTLDKEEVIQEIFKDFKAQKFIVNINPLIILDHRKDQKKKEIFNQQLIKIPDGEGIVLVSKLRSGNINKRIAGIDLMLDICKNASKKKKSIYLYGAKEGIAKSTKKVLEEKYSGILINGYISGYTKEEDVIKDINKSKAEILFIALGSPLQEDFIIRNKEKLKYVKVFMPVGGSFDVISGNLKRAPKLFQKLKIEWLYRMILEPKRFKGVFKLFKFVILSIFDMEVD